MPMPEADAPTVAVEVPEAEEKSKTISMARVAEYLPQRFVGKTGNKKAPDDLRSCAISLVTGRFLVLTDNILTEDKGVSSAARENLVNECTNLGLISALMLTIVVPMSLDNVNDWLEEDFVGSGFAYLDGWLGQHEGENQVMNTIPGLHDMTLICYFLGGLGYLCSTILTVLILLCAGEISTDAGVEEFLRQVGSGTRIPYLFWWNGSLFVIPAATRYLLFCRTLPGFITMATCMATVLSLIIAAGIHYVRSCTRTHNVMNEFEDLNLTVNQAEEDVHAWFAQNANPGTLQDCLLDLAATNDKGSVIPLDAVSQQHVAMHFHKKYAEMIGVPLTSIDLYRMAYLPGQQ